MSEVVFSIDKFLELLDNNPSETISGINVYQYAIQSITDTNGSDYNDLKLIEVTEYLAKQFYNNPNEMIKYLSEYVLSIIMYKTIKGHGENTDFLKSKISSSWVKLVEIFELENASLDIP